MSTDADENRRTAYRNGFNEGYRKGYEKGIEEGSERTKRKTTCPPVQFLRIQCECGATNYHPVFENKLVINEDEERRCFSCGNIVSRDDIFTCYSRLQSNSQT